MPMLSAARNVRKIASRSQQPAEALTLAALIADDLRCAADHIAPRRAARLIGAGTPTQPIVKHRLAGIEGGKIEMLGERFRRADRLSLALAYSHGARVCSNFLSRSFCAGGPSSAATKRS